MSERMEGTTRSSNTQPLTDGFQVTVKVSLQQLIALAGAEDQGELVLGQMSEHDLAKLNAHWYESLLVSLAFDREAQAFKINIRASQTEQLLYPHTGIDGGENESIKPSLRTPDGLPVYKPRDLLRAEDPE